MKIKKLSKVAFCVTLILLSIYSCEDEPVDLDQSQNLTKLKHGTNDFIKRSSINDFPNVKDYAVNLSKSRNTQEYRTEDDAYFTVIEDIDAYIFTDSLHTTYTIPIQKVDQTEFGFSNLVIKYNDDNPVKEFILNYVPTQEYLNNYVEYNQTPFAGTVIKESLSDESQLNTRTVSCSTVVTTYCCFVFGVPELGVPNFCGALHVAGPNCTQGYLSTQSDIVCSSTPQDFTIDAGNSGGGGGGGDGTPTTPIPSDTCTNTRGDVGLSNGDGCMEPENPSDDECVTNINSILDLDEEIESCLTSPENNLDICNLESEVLDFINDESDSFTNEEATLISEEFFKILCSFPEIKFIRFKELNEIIKDNPWALIKDCAEESGLDTASYLDLYNLPFPDECTARLHWLTVFLGGPNGSSYSHQPITYGNVPLANIDYYGVEVTSYPDFNNDGVDDSEAEIYQAFREKFTDVASGEVDDFQFDCNIPVNPTNTADISWEFVPLFPGDESDFISNDPIASILLIESEAEGLLPSIANDEGAVIVSEFTNNDWTISTITTPANGLQPFSGNRQWGWIINQNSNLELFTRAVDVANINQILNLAPGTDTECQQNTYYGIAEATWSNMQQEIVDWISSPESNGGQASVVPKTAVRVEKEKILELLSSNETIEEINCD